jgi:transposase
VLQAIRRLLARPKCFRPEREWPGGYYTHGTRAPLQGTHNNLCERILKKAILHRRNALFYRTLNGAHVGDIFMSLIHTAELNHIAPFEYLVALQRNAAAVAANPAEWMPWNYQATLAQRGAGPDPPA